MTRALDAQYIYILYVELLPRDKTGKSDYGIWLETVYETGIK